MPHAAISGTGLIGASIGLGLRRQGWRVTGWDPDAEVLERAMLAGAIDVAAASHTEASGGDCDLVVLAGPPGGVLASLADLDTGALVTDVAGVKSPVVAAAGHLARFVGGHPMAGREMSGPDAASAALFRGAAWVLATDGAAAGDVEQMERVVRSLGARPVLMTAAEHDAAVAVVSHLPQVLAAALIREAGASHTALDLAAGSFRDLTRVAASDPTAWRELLAANREYAAGAIRRYGARLESWADAIERGDTDALGDALAAARDTREGLAPPVVAVGVALADRPGELARVGHALETSAVDVRDLQLRHAPHGGGGLLSLFVRPGEAEALRSALADEGLLLAE
jgi:prephenate dehydrogenase